MSTIDCLDYLEHQLDHRQVDGVWICPRCTGVEGDPGRDANASRESTLDAPPVGSVSVWLNARGERLWAVRVPVGADPDAVRAAVELALEAERLVAGTAATAGMA